MKPTWIIALALLAVVAIALSRVTAPESGSRTKYEYAVRVWSIANPIESEEDLNRYGEEGWELVEAHSTNLTPLAREGIFKRPK